MKSILIAALTLALCSAVTARAEDKPGRPGRGGPQGRPGMEGLLPPKALEDLKLTDEQKAKYDSIVADFQKEQKAFMESHPELREKMKAAHEAGDKEAMKELFAEMKPMMDLRRDAMKELEGVLTEEQKATLQKMREEFGKHRPGGPGGPGKRCERKPKSE